MYLLYVDESGGDELGQDSEYFVLGGICVFERVPYHLSSEVEEIQQKFFPNATELIEFRASAVFNGNGEPWESMKLNDRKAVMRAMYDLLARETKGGHTLFGVALKKSDFATAPIAKTCEEMAGHFDGYLTSLELAAGKKERGLMIFDQSRHEKTVQALMTQYRTTGASFGRVKHLADVPLFTDSKITRMLQLADFVAYAIFRRYERSDAQFFDLILPRFHESGGVMHGLMHLTYGLQGMLLSCVHVTLTQIKHRIPI